MAKLAGLKKILLSSACMVGLMITTQAQGQVAAYYDNNVTVDLSVIEDSGLGNKKPAVTSPLSSAKLPPVEMPKSTFHGLPKGLQPSTTAVAPQLRLPNAQPQSRVVLKKPTSQMASPSMQGNTIKLKKPAPVAQPMPQPKKVEVAKTAPKPIAKPQPAPKPVEVAKPAPQPVAPPAPAMKKAEAPKPVPAPVKPVEVVKTEPVKAAPPAPKPLPKAPEAPKPTPAPAKVMAEAPPPPPPSAMEPKKVESAMKAETSKSKGTATAALPPASEASVRVAFQEGQSKLPSSSQENLKELAETLRKQPDDRVQLLAYAGGETLSASKARRLSLSRALAVRSYLIGQGVRSTRIDVRALGNKTTQEPFDRVDVQIAPR